MDGPTYVVDRLVTHRRTPDGTLEFLLRWYGYDEKTWEPRRNIPEELVSRYFDKRKTNDINDAATTGTYDGNPTLTQTRLAITQTLTQTKYEKRGTAINETINGLTKRSSVRYTTTKYRQDDDTKNDNGERETNATSVEEPTNNADRTNEAGTTKRYSDNRTFRKRRHEVKTDERRYSGTSRNARAN